MKFETKKFVKKITAVASATLMTMMPISGALATLNLANPFITEGEFDTYIAVGTCTWNTAITCENSAGMAEDIAGAIEVAAAFAQQAKTITSDEAVFERNVTAGHLNDSYMAIGGVNGGQMWDSTSMGFSWLANKTVQNSTNDDIANVTGKLSVMQGTIYQKEDGRVYVGNGAITYKLEFDESVGKNAKGIPFPDGNEYQIIDYSDEGEEQNITLGILSSFTANLGDEYVIGDSGVTIELKAATASWPSQAKVLIKDANGNTLVDEYWDEGMGYSSDALGITINLKTLKVLTDGTVDAVIDWTTSTLKLFDSDVTIKESGKWPNWTTHIGKDSEGITSIEWRHYNPVGIYVNAGTELQLLDGFFKLSVDELRIDSEDKKTALITFNDASSGTTGTDFEITFTDENGTMHYIDLGLIQDKTFGTHPTNETTFTWLENLMWRAQLVEDGNKVRLSNSIAWNNPEEDIVIENGIPFEINSENGNIKGFNAMAKAEWDTTTKRMNLSLISLTTDAGIPLSNSLTYTTNKITRTYLEEKGYTENITGSVEPLEVTITDEDGWIVWTFDFPVEEFIGEGNLNVGLIIATDGEGQGPAFQIHNNDGATSEFPHGTWLMSPWGPTINDGWFGWSSDNTLVSELDWIEATGNRNVPHEGGVMEIRIKKSELGNAFHWAASPTVGSGFYAPVYDVSMQIPTTFTWGEPLVTATNYEYAGLIEELVTPLTNAAPSSLNGSAVITEQNGNEITIVWDKGDISVKTTNMPEIISSVGETIYTINQGSKLTRVSDKQVTVGLADAPRIGDVAIGREDKIEYTLSVGDYSSVMDATLVSVGDKEVLNPISIGLAKLDTEITSSELEKPIILFGGPSVNALVKELVDANKSRAINDYEVDRAYIELIEDAFNGKTALVIAGYSGKDTRLAAQAVASQVLGTDMGISSTNTVLNTVGATISDVTVV